MIKTKRMPHTSLQMSTAKNASKVNSMALMKILFLIGVILSATMLMVQFYFLESHLESALARTTSSQKAFSPTKKIVLRKEEGKNSFQEELSPTKKFDVQKRGKTSKCDNIDYEDADDDLKPILRVLCQGGYDISKSSKMVDRSLLPKWSEIIDFYGPPKMFGTETCQKYRDKVPPARRNVSPAGMFNTGTNLLTGLILKNCDFSGLGRNRPPLVQVPWGKHTPFRFHADHVAGSKKINFAGHPWYETLAVVSIRDPYTWMQSMCKQPYGARWHHVEGMCPNIAPYDADIEAQPRFEKMKNIPVNVFYDSDMTMRHDSVAHLWNDWYADYIEFENSTNIDHENFTRNSTMRTPNVPLLLVRMEDLIFHGETVVPKMCECAGATLRGGEFHHVAMIANGLNHAVDITGGMMTGLVRSIIKYGNTTRRSDGYPTFQKKAAREALDSRLMDLMGYSYEAYETI